MTTSEDFKTEQALETQMADDSDRKRGGWITFPFIVGAGLGLTLAGSGWQTNMVVYLIKEFQMKSIKATQVSTIIYGCSNLFPVLGALLADSFLGCFFVVFLCSAASLLGMVLLVLTASIQTLRPPPCSNEPTNSCATSATPAQFAVLYAGIALGCLGLGGTRFTMATLGANQFTKTKYQEVFFNWYFFALYVSAVIGSTVIVFVEERISWAWGFGVCLGVNFLALASLLVGNIYFRQVKPRGSPFTGLARVVVATISKLRVPISYKSEDYYYGQDPMKTPPIPLQRGLRLFNRAALITEGDIHNDNSIAKPWRLTTVQQVQDVKALIRIFPIWSTSIFLCTPIAVNNSLVVLQALTMDRHIGHLNIPAGTVLVFVILSAAISLLIIDRLLYPGWKKIMNRYPSPLQRIGIGHLFNIAGMVISALTEAKRLQLVKAHHLEENPSLAVPMQVLWLVPQLTLIGIGEAFHFAGQVAFYYEEYPVGLKSTATAMQAVTIAVAYYLSSFVIGLTQRFTGWLSDNINKGRVDNVYWMLTLITGLNFVYFLMCSKIYSYRQTDNSGNLRPLETDVMKDPE